MRTRVGGGAELPVPSSSSILASIQVWCFRTRQTRSAIGYRLPEPPLEDPLDELPDEPAGGACCNGSKSTSDRSYASTAPSSLFLACARSRCALITRKLVDI